MEIKLPRVANGSVMFDKKKSKFPHITLYGKRRSYHLGTVTSSTPCYSKPSMTARKHNLPPAFVKSQERSSICKPPRSFLEAVEMGRTDHLYPEGIKRM